MSSRREAVRLVHREGILLFGGGRALLMQIAHPLVAAAVAEHSAYRSDRLGRLMRTLRPMLAIAFGGEKQAQAAAASVRATHERVHGAGYSASDPALLAWVLATLIDTSLLMYNRFVRPLSDDAADRYYREMLEVGKLLATPRGALPETRAEFEHYLGHMTAALEVTDDARTIAHELFRPLPGTGPAMLLMRELTAGLLPPTLRAQYGFPWGAAREAVLDATARASQVLLPLVPTEVRGPPALLMPRPARSP